jgi:hypothetical protein
LGSIDNCERCQIKRFNEQAEESVLALRRIGEVGNRINEATKVHYCTVKPQGPTSVRGDIPKREVKLEDKKL